MRDYSFTFMHLVALIVAFFGAIIWLHIPSIYLRAMFHSGNTFTMVELWETMYMFHFTPWVHSNSLVASASFLNTPINMSVLFLASLPLAYLGNFAWAFYSESMDDGSTVVENLFIPKLPFVSLVVLPYLAISYMLLIGLMQLLSTPIILYSIFVLGDVLLGVTMVAYFASFALAMVSLKAN